MSNKTQAYYINVVMHYSNILFSKESYNNNCFSEKKLYKKLFNFEVIFFLFNTEETETLIFNIYFTC